jgi:hypothetical protein
VQQLAGAPGVRAGLLVGADVAASVAYGTTCYLMIPYVVALYVRRQYLATIFPTRAGKVRRKGKSD